MPRFRSVPCWPFVICLSLVVFWSAFTLRKNAATLPDALLMQPCGRCRTLLYPDQSASFVTCPKCGHVDPVYSRLYPSREADREYLRQQRDQEQRLER